jgi:large subunit ribosomal protein L10
MHPAKATIVEDIAGRLNSSPFLFVADYTGLKVTQFAELRNRLFAVGAEFHVVKNTFLRRALTDAGLPEIDGLKGQSAIVTGEKDVAAAAKVVKTFAAEFKKPTLRAGIVDHLVVSSEQINAIADLPSRDVLLATLLGVLQAPGTKLVRVLNEPAASLARVLQAKVDQSGQSGQSVETSDATQEAPEAVAS